MALAALRDPVVQAVLHAGLVVLFATAAWHKRRNPKAFRLSLAGYAVVPESWVGSIALAIPLTEAAVALALATPGLGAAPALAAALILTTYAAAMGINLARGRNDIDCGCGVGGEPRPIGVGLMARNTLLSACAVAAALPAVTRPLDPVDLFSIAAAIAASVVLYAGVDQATRNAALVGASR